MRLPKDWRLRLELFNGVLKLLVFMTLNFYSLAQTNQGAREASLSDLGSALAAQCRLQPDQDICRALYATEAAIAAISKDYLECGEYRCYLLQGAILPLGHKYDLPINQDFKLRFTRDKAALIYECRF